MRYFSTTPDALLAINRSCIDLGFYVSMRDRVLAVQGRGERRMGKIRARKWHAITGWSERRVVLRLFGQELRSHVSLSIGFGLFWTWVWLVFQTTYFSPPVQLGEMGALPGWIVPLFGYAVTFLVLGGLLKLRGIVPRGRGYLAAIPAAMSFGVLILWVVAFSPLSHPVVNAVAGCAGGLLMGVGTACLHVEWGRALGDLGSGTTILHGVVGTVIAALITVFITLLPTALLWFISLLIPPASIFLLLRDTPHLSDLCSHGLEAHFHVPRRFLATAITQGLSFGIVQAILLLGGHQEPVVALSAASFALSAFVLFFCALFFRMDFNQLIYQVGFLIMAFGYLLIALAGPGFLGGLFVHATGYRFVDIMMWALCAHLIKQRGLNRASIRDELTLSRETVKTHVRNIYRKLGVHAQQDVVCLVAAERQTLCGDEEAPDEDIYEFGSVRP